MADKIFFRMGTPRWSCLSNFHPATIYIDGKKYASVEHAYQAHKTTNETSHDLIRRAATAAEAKKLGRCVPLRQDWEDVKVPLMRRFLEAKFENPFLRPVLLETGDAELIHDNPWNDRVWGVCRGTGQNLLGKILMEIRAEIRQMEGLEEAHGEASGSDATGPASSEG